MEQYLWLKVQPGSVRLDTRLKTAPRRGPHPRVPGGGGSAAAVVAPAGRFAGGPRRRHARSAADPPLRAEPNGLRPGDCRRFVSLDRHVGRGESQAAAAGGAQRAYHQALDGGFRRSFAGARDPGIQPPGGTDRPAFTAAWGTAGPAPLAAYSLASGEPAWSLATRPREPRTVVDQVLSLDFDLDRAEVQYQGRLVTQAGDNFRYQISAPAELEVEKVSLLVEGLSGWPAGAGDPKGP